MKEGKNMKDLTQELTERFYRYIGVPSQSESNGGTQVPSTKGQWDMAKLLQKECEEIGLVDLHLSEHCVLTGRLPARLGPNKKSAPAIGFCAHLDTVDVNLSPVVHAHTVENYDGGDIVLNGEKNERKKYAWKSIQKSKRGKRV